MYVLYVCVYVCVRCMFVSTEYVYLVDVTERPVDLCGLCICLVLDILLTFDLFLLLSDDPDEPPVEPIPEYTAREEYEDVRNWRPVQIAGISYRIDMRAIEPYKKVLSHGGLWSVGHELALDELEIIP